MRLILENVGVTAIPDNSRELLAITDLLTVKGNKFDLMLGDYPQARFYVIKKSSNHKRVKFLTGLYPYVCYMLASKYGVSFTTEDKRVPPSGQQHYKKYARHFTPYPDQLEVAQRMVSVGRGSMNLCTNSGKSFLIATYWDLMKRPSMLWVVPTQALLHQTSRDIENMFGMPEGSVGRVGDKLESWKPVTVGIDASLHNIAERKGKLPDFDVLVVDEGHRGKASRHHAIAAACESFYRFWMSGTLLTDANLFTEFAIVGLSGPCFASIDNKQLVDAGRSVKPLVRFISNAFKKSPVAFMLGYEEQYKILKRDETRNDLVVRLVYAALDRGLTVMTFVEHLDHLNLLSSMLGRATKTVSGGHGKANDAIKQELEEGLTKSVLCTSAWRLGVSIPGVDMLIQAGGRKSPVNLLQDFGRLLRKSPRGYGWYIDFQDKGLTYPRRHALQREKLFASQGFPVKIVPTVEDAFSVDGDEQCPTT